MTFCRRCHTQIPSQDAQRNQGLCGPCLQALVQQNALQPPQPPSQPMAPPQPQAPIYPLAGNPPNQPVYMNRQIRNRQRKWIVFLILTPILFVALISSLAIITAIKSFNSIVSPVVSQPPPPSPHGIVSTSVDSILSQYTSNQAASLDWLKQNSVSFTCAIDQISTSDNNPDTYIDFRSTTSSDPFNTSIVFDFSSKFRSQIDLLKTGQTVTVTGYYEHQTFSDDLQFYGTSIRSQ